MWSSSNWRAPAGILLAFIIYATLACLAGGCGIKTSPPGHRTSAADSHPDSLVAYAQAALDSGNYAGARERYRTALDVDPDHPGALQGLGDLHNQTNDPASARLYYRRLVDGPAATAEHYLELASIHRKGLSDPVGAQSVLEEGVARWPERTSLRIELAHLFESRSLTEPAREQYQLILARQPNHRSSLASLSKLEFDRKNYQAALPLLERLQKLDTGDYETNFRIGFIHFQNQAFQKALPYYRRAVDSRPSNVDARIGLAKTYELLDRVDTAIRHYQKALDQITPGQKDAPVILALANLLNKRSKFQRVISLITQRHGSSPKDAGLACALGLALAGNGQYGQAIRAFELAVADPQWSLFASTQIKKIKNLRSYE